MNSSGQKINIWEGQYNLEELDEFKGFPFELDHFQKYAIRSINQNENVLVTAHTGSGKSLVAEYMIRKACGGSDGGETLGGQRKKVIYTSPIKSLSNQKFHEFTQKFKANGISVGILTGDIKFNPEADCLIMTTEILRNLLYHHEIKINNRGGGRKNGDEEDDDGDDGENDGGEDEQVTFQLNVAQEVSAVVFDEVHYINDRDRGRVWEECMILLPSDIRLVMLSATIDQAEDFGEWLQHIKGVPLNLITTTHRVVPLKHCLYFTIKSPKNIDEKEAVQLEKYTQKLIEIMGSGDQAKPFDADGYQKILTIQKKYRQVVSHHEIFNHMVRFLHHENMCPAIFFTLSRRKCQRYAGMINYTGLNTPKEQAEVEKLTKFYIHKLDHPQDFLRLEQFQQLLKLMVKGIAYHHSGLVPVLKEIIEILFNRNLIKVLFATETFAVGVNMPTKTVLFTGLSKFDSTHHDFRFLETHEYLQMSGRAGRRGLDPIGYVIHLANLDELPSTKEMHQIMCGRTQKIVSKFTLNYQFLLKNLEDGDREGDKNGDREGDKKGDKKGKGGLQQILEQSLLGREMRQMARGLVREKQEMEESGQLSQENFNDCQRYEQLMSNRSTLKGGLVIQKNSKTVKNDRKKAGQMMKKSSFKQKYKRYTKAKKFLNQYQNVLDELHYAQDGINRELQKILQFLADFHFLEFNDDHHVVVKTKGILASQVSLAHPLWLVEILLNKNLRLGSLNIVDLAGFLSLFLEEKEDNQSDSVDYQGQWGKSLGSKLEQAMEIRQTLQQQEERRDIHNGSDWSYCLGMIELAQQWVSGVDLNQLAFGDFEGNFVRDMLKISHLGLEVAGLAEIIGETDLALKCQQMSDRCIRDIVNVESLYINTTTF